MARSASVQLLALPGSMARSAGVIWLTLLMPDGLSELKVHERSKFDAVLHHVKLPCKVAVFAE